MSVASESAPVEAALRARQPKRRAVIPLALAVVLQIALLAVAGVVVVVLPQMQDEPAFVGKKSIYLPQRQLDHQAAVSDLQQAAAAPQSLETLTTDSLLADDLPPLPQLPTESFSDVSNDLPAPDPAGLLEGSGLMAALEDVDAGTSEFSFMGIRDEAARLIIAFDISLSVVNNIEEAGMEIDAVLEETRRLIQGLNANTLVGVIQFSRSYDVFAPYLVPATVANKERLSAWLETEFVRSGRSQSGWVRESPNGVQSVLRKAFEMEPDVIFLLSDASFQRTVAGSQDVPWDELEDDVDAWQDAREEPARIHFVGFGVDDEDRDRMRSLVRRNRGRYRDF